MIKKYLENVREIHKRGDAREESYYAALGDFFKELGGKFGKNTNVTILPKKTEAGNPDFRIWDGKQRITGYIEAKEPGQDRLDYIEKTDQLKRYLKTFPNLILTNFLEFRLYRNGTMVDFVQLARPRTLFEIGHVVIENEEKFLSLMEKYFDFSLPNIRSPRSLAEELAKRTRFLRDYIVKEEMSTSGVLKGFYNAFKEYLIKGLSEDDFADLYSQTVTYGLFAARTRSSEEFTRIHAYEKIPKSIGILRDIFKSISTSDIPEQLIMIIDDIAEVLAVTDVKKILDKFYHEGKGKDPIVHFYETFLAKYDPKTRGKRGVYYTPEPVVSFIVRSVNIILKEKFNKPDGFADPSVTVLDPAAGTLTFIAEAAKFAVEEYKSKYGDGNLRNFIREHLANDERTDKIEGNFYAFELMMAPYAIGHIKMSFLLEELGYQLEDHERVNLYLTNTLEMAEKEHPRLPGIISSLTKEDEKAHKIKKEKQVLVIMGNPPYSGISANKGEWITSLLKDDEEGLQSYYKVDGKSLIYSKKNNPHGEKNPKWLQDDYVKFIRFSQWKIQRNGSGILGFITNHSYLDNPTFRGMRQSLMKTFDEIYIYDLHGNLLKKEVCPDGSKDENVFDIKPGVSIALFIKNIDRNEKCKMYHSDLWGLRNNKYEFLLKNDLKTVKWQELNPISKSYFFIPRNTELEEIYCKFNKINEIIPVNSVGIVTARDKLTIQWTDKAMLTLINNFSEMDTELARISYNLGKDARDWKVSFAQNDLKESKLREENIERILYRPFDIRYTYYTGKSRGFHCMPRPKVMKHMLKENLGLITRRQMLSNKPMNYFFISDTLISDGIIRSDNKGSESLFPLYLYNKPDRQGKLGEEAEDISIKKEPNYDNKFFNIIKERYQKEIIPEEIFYYIYGIMYSNIYREKYKEFLQYDFPRIPFTSNYDLFINIGKLGEELANLHLMKSELLNNPISKYHGEGNNMVEKPRYDEKEKRMYINQTQYFGGIQPEVYQYMIGGYQVSEKWLKDRKKRMLSTQDIRHYCRIITSLSHTINIQKDIDKLYPDVEKNLIEFEEDM